MGDFAAGRERLCFREHVFGLLMAAAVTAAPVKIAVPDVTTSGLTRAEGSALMEFFGERLAAASGAQVVTPSTTAALLGLERQKQLLGCDEGSSCLAELANAMGVDFVVAGSLVKLGQGFTVTLRLLDTRTAQARLSASERLADEESLSRWLATVAAEWGETVSVKARRSPAPLAVAIGGGVVAVVGGVLLGIAGSYAAQLNARPSPFGSADGFANAARSGATFQLAGLIALAAGVVAAGAGVGWWLFGSPVETPAAAPAVSWRDP